MLVPIASSAGIKRVPVVPRLVGAPASGQIVSTVSVDPQFVQLTGGSDALDGIESIETFDVDIAGATRAISRTVAMRVPANTSLASGEPAVATVLVQIRPMRAFVDLSGLAAGEHSNVPVIVERNRAGLARLALTSDPALFSFRLEQEIARTVPLTVEVIGNVPFSFAKGEPRLTQDGRPVDSVLIRGPQSRVDRVGLARVVADIDRLTGNYSSSRPVEILSQDGQEVAGVTAEPASIDVLVPIASSAGIKRVPVVPRLVGAPASGQIVSAVSVDPQFVQLTGGSDALDWIESIETFDVDITGATRTISRTVAMRVPANTSLASGEPAAATVLVQIRRLSGRSRSRCRCRFQVTDTPDGLLVSLSPNSIQIKLEGNAAALGAFDPAVAPGHSERAHAWRGHLRNHASFQLPEGVRLAEPAAKSHCDTPPAAHTAANCDSYYRDAGGNTGRDTAGGSALNAGDHQPLRQLATRQPRAQRQRRGSNISLGRRRTTKDESMIMASSFVVCASAYADLHFSRRSAKLQAADTPAIVTSRQGAAMALTIAEVEHVAHLARLRLSAEELEKMRTDLSAILDHIDLLKEVDVSDVAPTAQVTDLFNVMREDAVRPSLPREDVLANAPDQRDGMFRVKAIFEE